MHKICKWGDNLHTIMILKNGGQYYYRSEIGGHIQNINISINFNLPGLNHVQHIGPQI